MAQNAQNFINKVMNDPALKAKVLDFYKKNQPHEIEKLSKAVGTPCTLEEIENQVKASNLSDADLLKISGGVQK